MQYWVYVGLGNTDGASPWSRGVSALVLAFQAHMGKLKEVAPPPHAYTQSLG